MKLKEFDRQVGALVGLVKGVLLCVLITLFAVALLDEPKRKSIVNSRSGYYIAVLLDKAHPIMPDQVQDILHPYLHEKLEQAPDAESETVVGDQSSATSDRPAAIGDPRSADGRGTEESRR